MSQTRNACVRCRIPRRPAPCVASSRGAGRPVPDMVRRPTDARVSGAFGSGRGAAARAFRTPLGEQLERPLERQRLDVVAPAQARVRLAVGDVRPEAAVLDDERLAARRIGPELLERRLRRAAAAPLLRLREDRLRLGWREREELLLATRASGSRSPASRRGRSGRSRRRSPRRPIPRASAAASEAARPRRASPSPGSSSRRATRSAASRPRPRAAPR